MDVAELVNRAKEGDIDAFTELVRRYQAMAFGYAYANLGDFQIAEDIVQQAFVVAYQNLTQLENPDRFGGWLRTIVRFECTHLVRRRQLDQVPIDAVREISDPDPGPAELAECQESFDRVLRAINCLPAPEREATVLFYIHEHTQREVATFLNLPLPTVNNRLRSARKHLRQGGILTMARDAFRQHDLPNEFAERVGQVVAAAGPFIDIRFAADDRPAVFNILDLAGTDSAITAEVAQDLGDGLVRCIVRTAQTAPPTAGMQVVDTARPNHLPVDHETLNRIVSTLRHDRPRPIIQETGIKAIDLCCPLPVNGLVGIVGDSQSGKIVAVQEVMQRLAPTSARLTLLVFVEAQAEVTVLRTMNAETSKLTEAIFIPVADASPEALRDITDQLDAVISISRALATERRYPAIDPLRSTSTLLEASTAGAEHLQVVAALRNLLENAGRATDAPQSDNHSVDLIRQYLTQPFFVAEPYTHRAGSFVPLTTAISDCQSLLDGNHDDLDPERLFMGGSLQEILAGA